MSSSQSNNLSKSSKIQRRNRPGHKRGTSEVGRFFSNLLKSEEETAKSQTKPRQRRPHRKFKSLKRLSPRE